MGLFRELRERARQRGDRGLVFNAYRPLEGSLTGPREFVGLLVTEHDRAPGPIAFLPLEDFYEWLPMAERIGRLSRMARRVARNHELATGHHSMWTVAMDDVRCEREDEDERVGMLKSMILLPRSEMPDHFSPWPNWLGFFTGGPTSRAKGYRSEGPLWFGVGDADALARDHQRDGGQRNSGASQSPIVPLPASVADGQAMETTAA